MMTDGKPEDLPSAEDDAALWRLLERAPRPGPVSPYFARRVLREVGTLEENRPAAGPGAPGWLARWWQGWHGQARGVFAGALGAVALLAVGSNVTPWHRQAPPVVRTAAAAQAAAATPAENDPADSNASSPSQTASSEPPVAAQDVEIIADLDNLLSSEESRLWTDEDNTARF